MERGMTSSAFTNLALMNRLKTVNVEFSEEFTKFDSSFDIVND
jgi:hypothetical protein